jgi:hypothetical protein
MPNWCSNSIVITGDEDKIKKINEVLSSMDKTTTIAGIFEALVGRDENITEEQYQNGGWYQHNIDRYGCKWDVSHENAIIDYYDSDDCITMSPQTAWSPPKEFCILLAEQYGVDVTLEYSEPGCDFAGRVVIGPDGVEEEENYEYLEGLYFMDEDSFWMEVQSNLEFEFDKDEPRPDEDEPRPLEEWLNDFQFVIDSDKQELTELYNKAKEEQE